MLIRQATSDHIGDVLGISSASGLDVRSAETLRTTPERLVVVAEVEGRLVGAAKTHFHAHLDGEAPAGHYLGGVMVMPAHRRQGVAAAMTRTRLRWIWSYAETAYYFTNEHNTASARLHDGFGFHPLGSYPSIHGVTADDGQSKIILFAASR